LFDKLKISFSFSSGLFHQASCTTLRLSIYQTLLERFRQRDGRPLCFLVYLLLGVVPGGLGSFIGTPPEVALVRMRLNEQLPTVEYRN